MYANVFLKLIIIENGVHQIVNQREGIMMVECDVIEKVETVIFFLHSTLGCLTFKCIDIF